MVTDHDINLRFEPILDLVATLYTTGRDFQLV